MFWNEIHQQLLKVVLDSLKLMNHDISKVGKPTLFHRAKSIEKNIEKR